MMINVDAIYTGDLTDERCSCDYDGKCDPCLTILANLKLFNIVWVNPGGDKHVMGQLEDYTKEDAMMQDLYSRWIQTEEYLRSNGHDVCVYLEEVGV